MLQRQSLQAPIPVRAGRGSNLSQATAVGNLTPLISLVCHDALLSKHIQTLGHAETLRHCTLMQGVQPVAGDGSRRPDSAHQLGLHFAAHVTQASILRYQHLCRGSNLSQATAAGNLTLLISLVWCLAHACMLLTAVFFWLGGAWGTQVSLHTHPELGGASQSMHLHSRPTGRLPLLLMSAKGT